MEESNHFQHKENEGTQSRASRSRPRPAQRRTQVPKTLPGEVSIKILCHASALSGLIGNSGAVISQLRRETGSKIHCENPSPGSDLGVIHVIGSGSRSKRIVLTAEIPSETIQGVVKREEWECDVSSAQDAMLKVYERLLVVKSQNEGVTTTLNDVSCSLQAKRSLIPAVMGKGGSSITRMRIESGANIKILPPPFCTAGEDDEIVRITGSIFSVKKALIAVSSYLRDHAPSSSYGASRASDQPEKYFPNLNSLLPSMTGNSVDRVPNNAKNKDKDKNKNGTQHEVVFRLLCSNDAAGSVIGRKGTIVSALENETGATIRFAPPANRFGERMVTISAHENLESLYSPAQNALLHVFSRTVEGEIEKRNPSRYSEGSTVTVKLLVASNLLGCLSGSEGNVVAELREVTGANLQILRGERYPDCAPETIVVQINGEYKTVRSALFQLSSSLRNELSSRGGTHNEMRTGSPYLRVNGTDSSVLYQPIGTSPKATEQADITHQMNQLGLSRSNGTFSPRLQQSQAVKNEHGRAARDGRKGPKSFIEDQQKASGNKFATVTNTMVEMIVAAQAFGSIYGENGSNLDLIKQISGAKVDVQDPSPGKSEGKVLISGLPDQTLAAQSLLQAFIQTAKNSQNHEPHIH